MTFTCILVCWTVPKTGVNRQRIMDFIKSLRENPDTQGDITDRDGTDRIRQIKVIGDYAVTYWHDSAVNTVMVVDIRHADR